MKKKIVALLLSCVMAMSMTTAAFAADTVDDPVGDVIDSTMDQIAAEAEEVPSEDAAAEEVTAVLALGADLSSDQKSTVLDLLGLTADEAANIDTITVTNDEEHQYLDAYLDSSVIGTRSLSSVYVVKGEEGSGLDIQTHNITYCTVSMYANALITAGLEDATVVVAGPFELSGTAALIGTVKAYAEMTSTEVDEEALEVATEELVVTGELGDIIGDADDAASIMSSVKQYMAENDLHDAESIEAAVRQIAEENGYELTDDEVSKIVDVLLKIDKLDISLDSLKNQASAIFDKLGITSDTASGIAAVVSNFFSGIANFFKNLFS